MQLSHRLKLPETDAAGVQPAELAEPGAPLRRDEGITASGITFRIWRLYQHAWLVCLAFPLAHLLGHPVPVWRFALGSAFLVAFAVSYTWLMWPHPASQGVRPWGRSRLSYLSLALFVALSASALLFSALDDPAWLWLLIGTSAIAGRLLPFRWAFAVVMCLTLCPLVVMLKLHGGLADGDLWWLIALMLLVRGLGLDMIGVVRLGEAIRELQSARREVARLAVIEERERLARDLHDLLGQTLSMITLKSELARCLVEEDPERCAQELAEIEHASRKALRDVREAVAGYRRPTLASEIEGAQQLLAAAGISAEIDSFLPCSPAHKVSLLPVSPALDAVLAWTIREGVTNVVRHSRAHRCSIHLTGENGTITAEILNDGGARRAEEKPQRSGLGLAGLQERVALLGGSIEAGPYEHQSREGFRLFVQLPCSTT